MSETIYMACLICGTIESYEVGKPGVSHDYPSEHYAAHSWRIASGFRSYEAAEKWLRKPPKHYGMYLDNESGQWKDLPLEMARG